MTQLPVRPIGGQYIPMYYVILNNGERQKSAKSELDDVTVKGRQLDCNEIPYQVTTTTKGQ